MSSSIAALRALLEKQFPDATPLVHRTTEQVATGLGALDRILPGGGFPRGRLAVWAPQGGATAILRAACLATIAHGERAAWIDGAGTVAGAFWEDGPLLLRPKSRTLALRSAEEVLRCGGFGLVVLLGAEPEGTETVRLTRSARDGGAALVTVAPQISMASLRLQSQILPHSYRWRRTPFGDPAEAQAVRVRVHARAMGWNAHVEFPLTFTHDELRLSLESHLVDRRGVR